MSSNTALAISVGVLGAIATWLFLGPLGGALAIWAAFIAWGCFFHCGGKEQGLQSAILNNAAGAIIAGGKGTASEKIAALERAGIRVAPGPAALGRTMQTLLQERKASS